MTHRNKWFCFLCDPFGNQTIIDIKKRIHTSLSDQTLSSEIKNVRFNEFITIEFSNGNVAIIDEFGNLGKLSLMG